MEHYPRRDPRTVNASFDVWLARDLLFNDPVKREIRRYERFTMARKVRYSGKILRYLDRMEDTIGAINEGKGRAVAIKLGGMVRYLWRVDVLTAEEYDEVKKGQGAKLRDFRKKHRGHVGQGGPG